MGLRQSGTMSEFETALAAVAERLGGALSDVKRLSGGASQETWAFDAGDQEFILRRAPGGMDIMASAQAIGLIAEADVIGAALRAGAPAPAVAYVCRPEDGLGPCYVMQRLKGETIARKILRDALFAQARANLARQCGAALAAIHRADVTGIAALGVSDARDQLDRYEEIYRSFDTPRPMFELAFAHLRRLAPPRPASPRLIHGDFRIGNLMVNEHGLVAALDWELAHLGDPAEDLGWICTPSWRFGQIDNQVGGFGALDDLIGGYRAAGGDPAVTEESVRFWTIFGSLKWGIMCLIMFRAYDSGLDSSVERAAIGRRASETELDLALMLKGMT
jgi:aminoglycoside phosphotransferase (APT) family kinase protein